MFELLFVLQLFCLILSSWGQDVNPSKFPDDFIFGAATAAYQVEGGWNASGKGENIWDRKVHTHPESVADGTNGDVACDSYNKFRDDVALLKDLGVSFYRFSISWSRILPTGYDNIVNPDGIRYYNDLINELLANGIVPLATLYHWDLPQPLQDIGGWPNPVLVEHFTNYARVAYQNFGDRVKLWLTFNEPRQICLQGYGNGGNAPGIAAPGIGDYLCAYTVLKAHAAAWHLYDDTFRPIQNGTISITIDTTWYEPNTTSVDDIAAGDRMVEFNFGLYTNAIYHPNGDWPAVVKQNIAARSALEGFNRSRLPEFTPEEITYIQGTFDFFGLNHYTTDLTTSFDAPIGTPSFDKDSGCITWQDPSWPAGASGWLKVVPWGFRNLLNWIKNRYGNPPVYITENGFSDTEGLEDYNRINYYLLYLSALLDAIWTDGCNVKGYAAWSLIDNFEWGAGYTNRFGIHHVNFSDPNRPRTKKLSAEFYRLVVLNRELPLNYTTTAPPLTTPVLNWW